MTEHELEVLRLKNMLPENHKPIQRLHPTFKACSCGFVGTRAQFYHHIGEWMKHYTEPKKFFADHGEVPINEDDPRAQQRAALSSLLEESVKQKRRNILENL
jgi:hypothetical protein